MKCSMQGCPGDYEERRSVHTVRRRGQVVVIDHVPAEVCTVCRDVLLSPHAENTRATLRNVLRRAERASCLD